MNTSRSKKIFGFLSLILTLSLILLSWNEAPLPSAFLLGAALVLLLIMVNIVFSHFHSVQDSLKEISTATRRLSEGEFPHPLILPEFEALGGDAHHFDKMIRKFEFKLRNLSKERDHFRDILEGMIEGVIVTDSTSTIVFANPSIYGLLPIEGRCEGKSLLECVRHHDIQETLEKAMAQRIPQEKEITLQNNREEEYLIVYITPIVELQGPSGAILVFFDVTKIRKLENARKEFVANVSHELKTPLTSIRGYAETLRNGALADRKVAERFLEKIENNAAQLHNLIEDLLRLAEIESGRLEIHPINIDLARLLRELQTDYAETLQRKKLTFKIEIPHDLKVYAELAPLKQIFVNLLDNAVKYTSEGGRISVLAEPDLDMVQVIISDTGIGIPESDLPHVFERFYRVDKARSREVGGTGLGLAIVKHLVQLLGGEVGVRSRVQQGSDFFFTLPAPIPEKRKNSLNS